MYKRTTTHSPGVTGKAREIWGDKVFPIEIPETIAFPRAFNEGAPLSHTEPTHEGAQAYLAVARLIHPVATAPVEAQAGQPQENHHERDR